MNRKKVLNIIIILFIIAILSIVIGEQKRIKNVKEYEAEEKRTISLYNYKKFNIFCFSLGRRDTYAIINVCDEENEKIKNSKFGIYNEKGWQIGESVSEATGYLGFSGMETGIYYIHQIEAPIGYEIDNNLYKIEITDDKRYFEFEVKNMRNNNYLSKKEDNYYDDVKFEDIMNNRMETLDSTNKINIEQFEMKKIESNLEPQLKEDEHTYYNRIANKNLKDLAIGVKIGETYTEDFEDKEKYYVKGNLVCDGAEIIEYAITPLGDRSSYINVVNEKKEEQTKFAKDESFYLDFSMPTKFDAYLEIYIKIEVDGKRYECTFIQEYMLDTNNKGYIDVISKIPDEERNSEKISFSIINENLEEGPELVFDKEDYSDGIVGGKFSSPPGEYKIVKKINGTVVEEKRGTSASNMLLIVFI